MMMLTQNSITFGIDVILIPFFIFLILRGGINEIYKQKQYFYI